MDLGLRGRATVVAGGTRGVGRATAELFAKEGASVVVADINEAHKLLHGQETKLHADAGYTGVEKRPEIVALEREIEWRVAARRSTLPRRSPFDFLETEQERT